MLSICILSPESSHHLYAPMWPVQARILADTLALAEITPEFVPWIGDPQSGIDLARYDLVMPLLTWGYHDVQERWCAAIDMWEGRGVRLANPAAVLRSNYQTNLPGAAPISFPRC